MLCVGVYSSPPRIFSERTRLETIGLITLSVLTIHYDWNNFTAIENHSKRLNYRSLSIDLNRVHSIFPRREVFMFFGNAARVFFTLLNDLWSLSVCGNSVWYTLKSWIVIDNFSKCRKTRNKLWNSRGDGEKKVRRRRFFQLKMLNAWVFTKVVIL